MMDTPVLFLVFNRPDSTRVVFERIRNAKPRRLFVAADGPRVDEPNDQQLCDEVKEIIAQIDWECDCHTLFREANLGCKDAVKQGIDWFFKSCDYGIILEDDCVPVSYFFEFCSSLLKRYYFNHEVMMISGTNYCAKFGSLEEDYYFSNIYPIWGWATWKRAWSDSLDDSLLYLEEHKRDMKRALSINFLFYKIDDMARWQLKNNGQSWDLEWGVSLLAKKGLSIIPKKNLISNIGVNGTHAKSNHLFKNLPVCNSVTKEIRHPNQIERNLYLDKLLYAEISKTERNKMQLAKSYFLNKIKKALNLS